MGASVSSSMELTLTLRDSLATAHADDEIGALLAAARSGDGDALAALYDRLGRELYGLALWRTGSPTLAEDAVQELFCKLASGVGSGSAGIRSPRAWLFTILRRCAIDLERKHARELSGEETEEVTALFAAAPADAERAADHDRAARALAALPPKLREALFLRHWADLTFAEIGRVTGVPTFTAASRFRLGIARLRRDLGVRIER
jgi:RNA polymerase sigma-70 factor (ECF subfamily)